MCVWSKELMNATVATFNSEKDHHRGLSLSLATLTWWDRYCGAVPPLGASSASPLKSMVKMKRNPEEGVRVSWIIRKYVGHTLLYLGHLWCVQFKVLINSQGSGSFRQCTFLKPFVKAESMPSARHLGAESLLTLSALSYTRSLQFPFHPCDFVYFMCFRWQTSKNICPLLPGLF